MESATELSVALRTTSQALETKRLGTPVAGRVVANLQPTPDEFEDALALVVDTLLSWFGSPVSGIDASGSWRDRRAHLLLAFSAGQSALVSVSADGAQRPLTEIVAWGSRGVASWEGGTGVTGVTAGKAGADEAAAGSIADRPSEAARSVVASVRQRLSQGDAAEEDSDVESAAAAGTGADRASSAGDLSSSTTSSPVRLDGLAPPYGILLVAGDHTHQPGYAEAFLSDSRCRLIALTDQRDVPPDRRCWNEQLAKRLGLPYLADFDDALARPDVHVVSVCAEPYRRGDMIVQAANAGKHLYLDKPLCGSLVDADRIVAAVSQAGVVAHMFSQVYWPHAQQARKILADGELGELQAVHADLCFAKGYPGTATLGQPRRESETPQRFELLEAKRELTNIGIYSLVLLLWLLKTKARRVSARTANYFFAEHQQADMEDFGQALIEFDNGLTTTLTAARTGWQSHPGIGLNRLFLVGRQAAAVIDTFRPRVEVWSDATPWEPPPRDPEDPMGMWAAPATSPHRPAPKPSWAALPAGLWKDDTDRFLECLQAGRQSEISVELAAAATEILLAAYRSAATGQSVELPLPR